MKYTVSAKTDIGLRKEVNQDSLLVKKAEYDGYPVILALVCDGMGGLAEGELASASVIKKMSAWFEEDLPERLACNTSLRDLSEEIDLMVRNMNRCILSYGSCRNIRLGTTLTGILFIDDQYIIFHVGDSRIYFIKDELEQLTKDHTLVQKEIDQGLITPFQSLTDSRRNILLQCVGASRKVDTEIHFGHTKPGIYLLCSDGFRHCISEQGISRLFQDGYLQTKSDLDQAILDGIDKVKQRGEHDNISAAAILCG